MAAPDDQDITRHRLGEASDSTRGVSPGGPAEDAGVDVLLEMGSYNRYLYQGIENVFVGDRVDGVDRYRIDSVVKSYEHL